MPSVFMVSVPRRCAVIPAYIPAGIPAGIIARPVPITNGNARSQRVVGAPAISVIRFLPDFGKGNWAGIPFFGRCVVGTEERHIRSLEEGDQHHACQNPADMREIGNAATIT